MSISTLESRTSVRMLDAQNQRDDARNQAEKQARDDIAAAFAMLRNIPAKLISVPTAEANGAGVREKGVSMEYAIRDLTMDGYAMPELLALLRSSVCPLVQAYREALCAQWQKQNAGDVAEARS